MSSLREKAKTLEQIAPQESDMFCHGCDVEPCPIDCRVKKLWVPIEVAEKAEVGYENKIEELKRALRVSVESHNKDLEKVEELEGKLEAICKLITDLKSYVALSAKPQKQRRGVGFLG